MNNRRKRRIFIVLIIVSFIVFALLTAEFVCGLWIHRCYKSQNIYGNDTYICFNNKMYASYANIKKTGFNLKELRMVEVNDDDEIKFLGLYDIEEKGEPDDNALFYVEYISEDYLDIISEKYKDHTWDYVYYCVKVTAPEGGEGFLYRCINGPDSILKKGQMCKADDECITINDHLIGDKIELIDGTKNVTGIIKTENLFPPSSYGIPFAMYDTYYYFDSIAENGIIYSYNEYLTWKQSMIENDFDVDNYRHHQCIFFDRSAIAKEDLESLEAVCKVMSLKDAYGRYATAYVYIFAIFPILFLGLLIFSIRRLIKSFR